MLVELCGERMLKPSSTNVHAFVRRAQVVAHQPFLCKGSEGCDAKDASRGEGKEGSSFVRVEVGQSA